MLTTQLNKQTDTKLKNLQYYTDDETICATVIPENSKEDLFYNYVYF